MRMMCQGAFIALVLLPGVLWARAGSVPDDALPATSEAGFSAYVQGALGIPLAGTDALRLLDAYRDRFSNQESKQQARAMRDDLALAILRGMEPDSITRQHIEAVTIRQLPAYGPDVARRHFAPFADLYDAFVKQSAANREADAAAADHYARAAIVLASQDRLVLGFAVDPLEGPLLDALIIDEGGRRKLLALRDALRSERAAAKPHLIVTSEALLELIQNPNDDARWNRLVPAFAADFERGWGLCRRSVAFQYFFASNAWRLVCLARRHGKLALIDTHLKPKVEALIEQTVDPLGRRWLKEIFWLEGDAPRQPAIRFFRGPQDVKPGYPN
jgi:hypothetical protein